MAREGGGIGIVGIAAAAGLAYWAYSTGLLSALFGTTAAVATTTTPVTTTPAGSGAGTNPVATAVTPTPVTPAPTPAGPCPLTGVLAPALALATTAQSWADPNAPTSVLNMDQWNYYLGQVCTGLSTQVGAGLDAGAIFPERSDRGGPLNWTAYKGYATAAGLSGARIAGSGMGTNLARRRGVSCC